MESKSCLVVLLLVALAMVAAVESSKIHDAAAWPWSSKHRHNNVDDMIGEENEMLLEYSEAGRRQLSQRDGFISYDAMVPIKVPCGSRGISYYTCNNRKQGGNVYNRGCSSITRCTHNRGRSN